MLSQLAITCPKLTIETVEQGVKYVQSYCSSVSIVNFEQENAGWDHVNSKLLDVTVANQNLTLH